MKHFTMKELHGRPEDGCPEEYRRNLELLGDNLLDPWRELVGRLSTHSGFRSAEHNAKVKGQKKSQHLVGQAWDGLPLDCTKEAAWDALMKLEFDQAIWEYGCIHVSYHHGNNRKMLLRQTGVDKEGNKLYGPF